MGNAPLLKYDQARTVICRSHPQFNPAVPTIEQMWRIVWAIQKARRAEKKELRECVQDFEDRISERVGRAARAIRRLRAEVAE